MNISEVNITKATQSNLIALKKKNRVTAIKIAKKKADYLLSANGEQTGKPMINNEQAFVNANYHDKNSNYSMIKAKANGLRKKAVDFQKIKITSSMYVKFQIK